MAARSGRARATVRDVAAETGLSIATVSRVLNGQANVAPHTRELVLRAVGASATRRRGRARSTTRLPAPSTCAARTC